MSYKYTEYAVFWRFRDDHNPNNWKQIGKPTKDLTMLREIFLPEGTPDGVQWVDDDKIYKIMQHSVSVSDWRAEEVRH